MKLLVINGPNLNMLGIREKRLYGEKTYEDLKQYILEKARELMIAVFEKGEGEDAQPPEENGD